MNVSSKGWREVSTNVSLATKRTAIVLGIIMVLCSGHWMGKAKPRLSSSVRGQYSEQKSSPRQGMKMEELIEIHIGIAFTAVSPFASQ